MMEEKICPLKLKMKVYVFSIMKFRTKIKKTLGIRCQPIYDEKYKTTKERHLTM